MSAPKAPDPYATAQAQGAMNKQTAIAQQELNMVNQNTPWGSLNYQQTGTSKSGTPQYTATQQFDPKIQGTIDQLLGNIQNRQAVDLSGDGITQRQMDLYSKYMDPIMQTQKGALDAELRNKGITAGSNAYNTAKNLQSRNESDNYINFLLNSRGQAQSEAQAESMQPYQELNAFQGIINPSYVQTPQSSIRPTDYTSLVNQQFQSQTANHNAMMSGLFGTGSAVLGGWARSDRRVKDNIERLGTWHNGLSLYSYTIDGQSEVGFMADEVALVHPHAVKEIDGILHVNYAEAIK